MGVPGIGCSPALKILTSLTLRSLYGCFSEAVIAFGVFALFLPAAIAALGDPEGYFNSCDHSIWSIGVQEESRLLNLRSLESSRFPKSIFCFRYF